MLIAYCITAVCCYYLHSRVDLVCVVSNAGGVEAGYSVSTAGYKTEPHLKEESVPSGHQCTEDTSHPTAQNRVF